MNKKILVIDDNPDERALIDFKEEIEFEVNQNSNIFYPVELVWLNPLSYIDFKAPLNNQLISFFAYLDTNFLNQKMDMLLCDFNLHAQHKHLAFYIIDYVRKYNKVCTIILFSGSPLKELIRLNNADLAKKISEHIIQKNKKANVELLEAELERLRSEEEPAEELLNMAVRAKIDAIVPRNKFEEKAIELIKKPSLQLYIESELLKHGETIFNDGNELLNGKELSEIAALIREQSDEGIYFTNEILQSSLANMIKLHSAQ